MKPDHAPEPHSTPAASACSQPANYGPLPPSDMPPDACLRDPADVVALVPHRLGFQPRNSLVAVLIAQDGMWIATARHDVRPGVPVEVLADWLDDVGLECSSLLIGVYAQQDAGRALCEELEELVPQVSMSFVVSATMWALREPDGGWLDRGLDEVFGSASQLEALASGSVPLDAPAAHDFAPATEALTARWSAACAARSHELDMLESFPEHASSCPSREGESSHDVHSGGRRRHGEELLQEALAVWERVLRALDELGDPEAWPEEVLEDAVFGMHALRFSGIGAGLLVQAAGGGSLHEPREAFFGLWEGPVNAQGLHGVQRALERFGSLMSERGQADALSLLAWLEWAVGHGSVAGATLRLARTLEPAHELSAMLEGVLETGHVPLWLRPRHGGRGAGPGFGPGYGDRGEACLDLEDERGWFDEDDEDDWYGS